MGRIRTKATKVIHYLEDAGLLSIALATLVAVAQEIMLIYNKREVSLADLLLLFIYLEVLVMVSSYLNTGKMPIRIPIYIAIVAMARYVIIDMKNMESERLLIVAVSTLIMAVSVLVIRYGHLKFPYPPTANDEKFKPSTPPPVDSERSQQ